MDRIRQKILKINSYKFLHKLGITIGYASTKFHKGIRGHLLFNFTNVLFWPTDSTTKYDKSTTLEAVPKICINNYFPTNSSQTIGQAGMLTHVLHEIRPRLVRTYLSQNMMKYADS